MSEVHDPCPVCGRRLLTLDETGGVVFLWRTDAQGHSVDGLGMVAVIGVPVLACCAPGCLWGKVIEAAAPFVERLAAAQGPDAVRIF